ncbi:cation diffusion facilitator family transporter [Leekyejoonella antrihumi]|uniref:Cation diffusion facilitator family transporter n=1 Tax=Leekyejoonella antrihumi TaxID=1660198 RepID=A0A563DS81_9MICO|nr:cation diffusion facilitator family transporter [Leekyejoonella antrihumi]
MAFVANALIAIAKTVAALLTGSASMVAEAAHSWADTGNEIFLLIAEKRGAKPRDQNHPRGYGRETYVWSMFAAVGLFTAGAVVSVLHGVQQIGATEESPDYLLNYAVLAVAFVLEGTSFRQALKQARGGAARFELHPLTFISQTSNTTLRAVFLEDFAALIGLILAAIAVALHEITGAAVWDALGSIAVGLLLAVVAIFLINRNREFLVGQSASPTLRAKTLASLLEHPEIERITYLHLEFVGPMKYFVVAAVDLVGNDDESHLAVRLRRLESEIEQHDAIEDIVLTLSTPSEPSLTLPGSSPSDRGSDGS